VGGEGRARAPLTHIQSNACRFLFLLFIYLRFAEAASFDKKSYAGAIQEYFFFKFVTLTELNTCSRDGIWRLGDFHQSSCFRTIIENDFACDSY
jgi:hypothetical protein